MEIEFLYCARCKRVHAFGYDIMGCPLQLLSCRPARPDELPEQTGSDKNTPKDSTP